MEHDIKIAIFALTGLVPEEDRFTGGLNLSLGRVDSLIVGFAETERKPYTLKELRYSALLAMLKAICEMMEDNNKVFSIWLNKQK